MFASKLFGDDLQKCIPVVDTEGSDSGMFDNVLELLFLARAIAAARDDDDDPRAVVEPRIDVAGAQGLLRVPRLPDGALGRSRLGGVHRRRPHRRHARPQRAAPVALLRHQGRPRRDGVGGRRARHPAGAHPGEGAPAAGAHVPGRHRAGADHRRRRDQGRDGRRRPLRAVAEGEPDLDRRSAEASVGDRARSRHRAAAPGGLRLHQRGPQGAGGADGASTASRRTARWGPTRRWRCCRTSRSCSTATSSSCSPR